MREIEDPRSFGGVELLARLGEQRGRGRGVQSLQLELGQLASGKGRPSPGRVAKSAATASARSRRTANASASAEARIEPVRIVDEEQERTILGGSGKQRERRRPDRERRRALLLRKPEGRAERIRLSGLEPLELGRGSVGRARAAPRTPARPPTARRGRGGCGNRAALAAACSRSAVLPIPGSPTSTSAALIPSRAASSSTSMRRCSLPRRSARSKRRGRLTPGTRPGKSPGATAKAAAQRSYQPIRKESQ